MGLTKRRDSYYVEFVVLDDGKYLRLAPKGIGKLKRWKVGSRHRGYAKDQEAIIKTKLLAGQIVSPAFERAQALTFREWADTYLSLEEVRKLTTYEDRKLKVSHLVDFFGDLQLVSIRPDDIAAYRNQRVRYTRMNCPSCGHSFGRATCPTCGWKRTDRPQAASMQTINHDHTALTHMFNVARSTRFQLIHDNPATHVEKPNPKNERDRIASLEEWEQLKTYAAPHLLRLLIIAQNLGPRRGELLKLEWPDVDLRRREFTLRQTKNGETRVVPMTQAVYAVFSELWEERSLDTHRVFLYKGKPWKNPRTAFTAACRRAGIRNLRLHDFRHTATTNLRRAGVDTMTAMKIVGHKSEQMHRRYNSIEPADLHKAALMLETYAGNTLITPDEKPTSDKSISR